MKLNTKLSIFKPTTVNARFSQCANKSSISYIYTLSYIYAYMPYFHNYLNCAPKFFRILSNAVKLQ